MFLHISHSVPGGRGRERVSVWCHFLSGCLVLCSFQGGGSVSLVPCSLEMGSLSRRGGLYPGEGVCQRDPPDRDTHPLVRWREGGTHPTRMLSCNYLSIIKPNSLSNACLFFLSDEYDFIPVVEPQNNCNPIVLENHKLGVQIWATKVLFSYAYAELMNIVKSRQSIKTTG